MKILDEGLPNVPHPHKCQDALWKLEQRGNSIMNLGIVVECDCGAHWRVQSKIGLRASWTSTYHGSAYWVKIKRGK